MDKIIEIKSAFTVLLTTLIIFLVNRFFTFFNKKIKEIDSIEGLKKDFNDFKLEQKEQFLDLKNKIDEIHKKIYK